MDIRGTGFRLTSGLRVISSLGLISLSGFGGGGSVELVLVDFFRDFDTEWSDRFSYM